ncbi:MAG: LytR C-terminal domain-containing protein [Bifidobacteriaceae bacterium]|jgi:hypothetical protein|nr:LytR C-terminal domain-containing protein [Bifidobacteriaceae bacterium]MCI1978832.1 LytR C-terminal domain-containing protein [Bifidobacteriaceae bacterium]
MARNKSEEAPLHDEFENPQAGPIGLHRGDRSLAARLLPYLVTLVVAVALAFCAWLWMSGKGREFFVGSSTSSSQTASSTGASAGTSSDDSSATSSGATSQNDSDTKSTSGTDSDSSSSDSDAKSSGDSASTKDDKDSASDDADSSKDKKKDDSDSSAADTSTQIVVYNGLTASPSGFAAGKASTLKSAGYTNVSAKNLQNSAPSANVVWYKTAADEATAKAVAAKLGISQTHLAPKLAVSVGVIYVSQ